MKHSKILVKDNCHIMAKLEDLMTTDTTEIIRLIGCML